MKRKKAARISTFGSRMTSIISVALTLTIVGILAVGISVYHNATNNVRHNMTVTIRAVPNADDISLNRIKRLVRTRHAVSDYTFLSADQVLAQEVEYIGPEVSALLDENPYSAEFEVHLKPEYACRDSVLALCKAFRADKAVDDVLADVGVIENVNHYFNNMAVALGVIAAVLMLISFVLINNTVSLSIYSRRFLINSMKLVGATPCFIRRPFVWAGVGNGLFAGILAAAVLCAVRAYADSVGDVELVSLIPWEHVAVVSAGLVLLGCVICAMASWWATTRYLRRTYDSLYRK